MRQKRKLFAFALVWSLITLTILVAVIYDLFEARRSASFAKAQGSLDSIHIVEDTDPNMGFVYHYTVYGRLLENRRVVPIKYYASDSWEDEMCARFPIGSHPIVYYNPSIPAESVLVPGIQKEDLHLVLWAALFVLGMLVLWGSVAYSFRKLDRSIASISPPAVAN